MRISIVSMVLFAAVGCSPKPFSEHHVLPVGFSGVYKIEKAQDDIGGYEVDGSCYIFTIPESGILRVDIDVFEATYLECHELTASFVDGQEISLYDPLTNPPDSASDDYILLGLFGSGDAVWYAVGTYDQLSRFLEKVRREKYQNLEKYLPPNMPFQTDDLAGGTS